MPACFSLIFDRLGEKDWEGLFVGSPLYKQILIFLIFAKWLPVFSPFRQTWITNKSCNYSFSRNACLFSLLFDRLDIEDFFDNTPTTQFRVAGSGACHATYSLLIHFPPSDYFKHSHTIFTRFMMQFVGEWRHPLSITYREDILGFCL